MNDDSVFGNYYQPSEEPSQLPQGVDYSVWEYSYDISDYESSDNLPSADDLPELIPDDSDNFSSDDCLWQCPQVADIEHVIHGLDECEEKQAYQTLLDHNTTNREASSDWFPFTNELAFFLFIGRYDPDLAITRSITDYFLMILHTMQQNGVIAADYFIPKSASTVEKWWQYIPQPPLS